MKVITIVWVFAFLLGWFLCRGYMQNQSYLSSNETKQNIYSQQDTLYYFIGYATKNKHFGGFFMELQYPSILDGDDVYDTLVKNLRDRGIKINNSDCAITSIYQFKNKEEYENFKK